MLDRTSPFRRAIRLRWVAGSSAVLSLVFFELSGFSSGEGEGVIYEGVFALGYVHLLGSLWSRRRWLQRPSARLPLLVAALFVGQALVLYSFAVHASPAFALPLLWIATWHSIENDRRWPELYAGEGTAKSRAGFWRDAAWMSLALLLFYRAGAVDALALQRLDSLGVWTEPLLIGLTGLVGFRALWVGELRGAELLGWLATVGLGLAFADALGFARLFGLVTLFHVFAWAHYVAASAAVRAGNAAAAATLLPYIAALMIPFGLGQFPEFDDLRALVFSPAWYLFFTTLHVAETAPFLRGPRRPQLA